LDRGLIGVLLICLVASSILVLLFLGEHVKSPITVLKVEYPERIGPGEPSRFALNVLARGDVEDLKVEYSYLTRISGKTASDLYAASGFNQSVLQDEDPVSYLAPEKFDFLRKDLPGGEVPFETQRMEVPYEFMKDYKVVKKDLQVSYYDYRTMMEWTPESAIPNVFEATLCFAFVSLPEGNISVYQGHPDFYLNRPDSMTDLEYGKGESSQLFVNPAIREVGEEDYVHINEAPAFGTVHFGSLEKGERAFMSFTTRDLSRPSIQVIRFWVNGELVEEETRFNFLGGPL
jgi:hypothetical protein